MPDDSPTVPDPASVDIKVTDRRPFTSDGQRRTLDSPPPEKPRTRAATPPRASGREAAPTERGGIGFESFIQYLAQVALHQMAGSRHPETGEAYGDLEEARQTIEILRMLEEKTRGNLNPREAAFLEEIQSHLKLEYARRSTAARR